MLRLPVGLICLLAFFVCSVFSFNDTSYNAVVVEFDTRIDGELTAATRIAARLSKIVDIINAAEHSEADIIVFPEYALEELGPQIVSNPADNIVLCSNVTYSGPLVDISCAAKLASTYIVLNVLTQHNCTQQEESIDETLDTPMDDICIYNSNVVFDRLGAVISIYHKYHIYGERVNQTATPETVFFDTDFGVKFGHLICFDILFEEPASSLLKMGVKNFVFPAKWYSEIPFLTAIQIQQGWAHSHGVNLLAAGISDPAWGSTGSGIYSGTQGALTRQFSGTRRTVSLSNAVSKEPGQNVPETPLLIPLVSPQVYMLRDFITNYTIEALLTNDIENSTELCYEHLCCRFNYQLKDVLGDTQSEAYEYVAGVYNGMRPFGPDKVELRVVSCAVFACTNASDIDTCAIVATTPTNRYQFQKLEINGQFRVNNAVATPNTLTVGLVPLLSDHYQFNSSEAVKQDLHEYSNVSIALTTYNQHLMTFGIWGREYSSSATQPTLLAGILLISALILNLL